MWRKILVLVGPDRERLPTLFLMFLLLSAFELVSLGLLIPFINYAVNGSLQIQTVPFFSELNQYISSVEKPLFVMGLIVFVVFLIKFVGTLGLTAFITQFAQNQRMRLGSEFLKKYLAMDYLRYLSKRDADGVYEVQISTTDYFTALQIGLKFLSETITLALLIIMLISVNPLLTLILFSALLVVTCSYAYFTKSFLVGLGVKRNLHESRIVEICQNSFRGFREIRLLNKAWYFIGLLSNALGQSGRISVITSIFGIVPRQVLELLIVFGFLLAIFIKGKLGVSDDIFVEIAAVYLVTVLRMLPLVTSMTANYTRMRTLSDSIDRIFSTVGAGLSETESHELAGLNRHCNDFKKVCLKNVSFSYSSKDVPVLNNVNLTIEAGDIIGVVGSSGSGKTTLLGLISGFLKPVQGAVELTKFENKTKQLYGSTIAYLPQDALMINGSLKQNITLSDDNSPETVDAVNHFIKKFQLETLVSDLPEGIDTDIGQSGGRLSAGQRQRVGLARVAYHRPQLLILDEATNALDVDTERKIFEQLGSIRNYGAIIIVSHRPSTLEYCDRVFSLKQGRLLSLTK